MILKRFYNAKLAHASYLVGCSATGEAVVIDPNRDAEQYIVAAEQEGLRVTAVTETHIHADYLSGVRELAARTGATIVLSDEGPPDWKYEFRTEQSVRLVVHGDSIRVGNVRLDVLHTPGHTPEHITFLLTDEPASDKPLGAFTGDFVFVGDVGRPDLLERAAKIKGTMETGGRQLFASLQSFARHADGLLIWPAHGAGSACGKSLGGVPVSSLGYERAANWAFKAANEDEFVDEVLRGQPDPPRYFATMKKLNKEGPRVLGAFPRLPPISVSEALRLIRQNAQVVDTRESYKAMRGFVRGTIGVEADRTFIKWSGWLLSYDEPIYLISNDQAAADQAAKDLGMIGLDNVRGWVGHEIFGATELTHVPQIDATDMGSPNMSLLDVRSTAEYDEGHVPGTVHIPIGEISDRIEEVPKNGVVAVHCSSGGRSPMAAMLLKRLGIDDVCNVLGGFDAYKSSGRPVEVGDGRSRAVAK